MTGWLDGRPAGTLIIELTQFDCKCNCQLELRFAKSYCQAQPQSQISWAELALVMISQAARPAIRPSRIVVKKLEKSKTCFLKVVGLLN
jgi:hypothetical protein